MAAGDHLAPLLQEIFQRGALIKEDAQVIADHMARVARGTLDEHRAAVVALLGHAVRGAVAAWLASKHDAVGFFLLAAILVVLFALWVLGFGAVG
jgi:hypothetical protein